MSDVDAMRLGCAGLVAPGDGDGESLLVAIVAEDGERCLLRTGERNLSAVCPERGGAEWWEDGRKCRQPFWEYIIWKTRLTCPGEDALYTGHSRCCCH